MSALRAYDVSHRWYISYSVYSALVWQINSCISTLRTSAICANVFKSGCAWLLHHFDTVAGSLCNVLANHLLIIPLSANTVLIRFKSAMLQLFVVFDAKLLLLNENKELIHMNLPKRVLFSQIQSIFVFKMTCFVLSYITWFSSLVCSMRWLVPTSSVHIGNNFCLEKKKRPATSAPHPLCITWLYMTSIYTANNDNFDNMISISLIGFLSRNRARVGERWRRRCRWGKIWRACAVARSSRLLSLLSPPPLLPLCPTLQHRPCRGGWRNAAC